MRRSLILLAVLMIGCAPVTHNTPSQKPEVVLPNVTVSEAKSRLIRQLLPQGFTAVRSDEFTLVLSHRFDRMMDTYVVTHTYTVLQEGPNVRIIGAAHTHTSYRDDDTTNKDEGHEMQQTLNALAADTH